MTRTLRKQINKTSDHDSPQLNELPVNDVMMEIDGDNEVKDGAYENEKKILAAQHNDCLINLDAEFRLKCYQDSMKGMF